MEAKKQTNFKCIAFINADLSNNLEHQLNTMHYKGTKSRVIIERDYIESYFSEFLTNLVSE